MTPNVNVHIPDAGGVHASTAVVLPCSPDQFSNFIAGLLGRPQELSGRRKGQFRVDKAEAMQLHHLITQRVQQQQGTKPLQFTARIGYDNGTNVQVNEIDDFQQYQEVRPLKSTSLLLTWTFLLPFPGENNPKKQEIEVLFLSDRSMLSSEYDEILSPLGIRAPSFIHYKIRHTARTWGADIESLISTYIKGLLVKETPLRSFLRNHSIKVGLFSGLLMFMTIMYGLLTVNDSANIQQASVLLKALGPETPVPAKVDALITHLNISNLNSRGLHHAIYIFVGIVASLFLTGWVETLASRSPPSHVVLTKLSEEEYANRLKTYQHSLWTLFGSVLGGIILAVASNAVYDFYVKGVIEKSLKTLSSASTNIERHHPRQSSVT